MTVKEYSVVLSFPSDLRNHTVYTHELEFVKSTEIETTNLSSSRDPLL
jgi:hypothetical protein